MQSFRIVLTAVAFAISLPAMADSTHDFAECTMDAIEAAGASPFTESESQEVDAAAAYLQACMVWDGYTQKGCWQKSTCWSRSS